MMSKKMFVKNLLMLCGFLLFQSIIYTFTEMLFDNIALQYILSYIIPIGVFIATYHNNLYQDLKRLKEINIKTIIKIIVIYIILISLMFLANYIITHNIGQIAQNELLIRESIFKNIIPMAFAIIVLGPIFEEFIFRYNFNGSFNSPLVAYITTSFIFAISHLLSSTTINDLLFFIPYLLMAFAFGYGNYKTNNIYTSICIHIFHNLLNFVLLFIL